VQRCLRLVHRELRRLTQAPLSPRALAAAQRQLCGQLAIGAENTENHTLATAKLFLHTNHVRTLSEQCSVIWQLTPETLHQIAMETLQPQRITTLIYQ
jgi:predicted Zn-dependent peptidase